MKKSFFVVMFSLLLIALLPMQTFAALYDEDTEDADVIYMLSLDDGTVIAEKNPEMKVAPASITKIVTAIVTIESCSDLEDLITIPPYCIRLLDGTNSSTAGLYSEEQLTVRQLLYCLLVASANDAANVLADYVGKGSIETFVKAMNDFVDRLGCENTHFSNAHGLDAENHYTTAKDLAKIYTYCLKNSLFTEIAGTFTYEIPPTNKYSYTRTFQNTNNLMNPGIKDYYCEYAKNGKTGTTDDAGRCLVSSASKDGYNYLCIVLKAKFYDFDGDNVDENMAFILSKKLYTWAFDNIRLREVANPNMYVTETSVRLAKDHDYVSLVPAQNVSALVPVVVGSDSVYIEPYADQTPRQIDAPVKKGEILGRGAVKYAGETIAEVDLCAAYDVRRSNVKFIGDLLKQTLRSTAFKIVTFAVFLLLLPICIMMLVVFPRKRKKRKSAIRMVVGKDLRDRS